MDSQESGLANYIMTPYFAIGSALVLSMVGFGYFWMHRKVESHLKLQILTEDSFKEIIQEIRVSYSKAYNQALVKSKAERRSLPPRSLDYERTVNSFHKESKTLLDEATRTMLKKFRIGNDVLQNSINYYDSDIELREYGESLVHPIQEIEKVSVSKQETKEVLMYFQMRMQEMRVEELDFDEYIIVTSQISDEVFEKFGHEIEEINAVYEANQEEWKDLVQVMKSQTSYILAAGDDSFEF